MRLIKIVGFVVSPAVSAGLFLFAFLGGDRLTATVSPDAVWTRLDGNAAAVSRGQTSASDSSYALRLNRDSLAQLLARAPMVRTGLLRNSPAVLSLPMPDGSFQRFHIEESPVLDAELAAQYPEIKSYRGQGIDDETATVRFDWTPLGFHALVISADQPAVNIQPLDRNDLTMYASYYDRRTAFECSVKETLADGPVAASPAAPNTAVGATLRTERIAVAATWEFCNTIGGDTLAGSIAAINAYLNATNVIYEKELAVHMNLVNAPNIIYASNNPSACGGVACNAGNDPYTNNSQAVMLNEVDADINAKVGVANFDIGHVLGTGSAGVAARGVVCNDNSKAVGATRIFGPPGDSGAVSLWAHELGHQHGAAHSFNGTNGNCSGSNRSGSTAWEPGSGTTLMSYAGICSSDNVAGGSELRFHNGSFNQIISYLNSLGTCGALSATGDNVPSINAGIARTIPKLTPFTLSAFAGDADAADVPNLRFVWEQIDAGGDLYPNPPYGDQPGDPVSSTRPLFRTFPPTSDRSRTFPSLTYILNNANVPPATLGSFQTAEKLPGISRTMNFRATVRDQRFGVSDSSVAITVDGNSGPFAVTAPNGGGSLSGNQTVTWNVNGTNAAPVSAANVKISLSTDGGNTFPIVLAASVPNNGSAGVTIPNGLISSAARIKVEAVDNIFFDISDANFAIAPADTCPAVSGISPNAGTVGTNIAITGTNFMNGGNVTAVRFANNVNASSFSVLNNTTISATVPAGAVGGAITLSKAGCPDVQTPAFTVCPSAAATLMIDDNLPANTATSIGSGAYYVNRLTPASYPATLTQISISWTDFQDFYNVPINIVAAANPTGAANIDGVTFRSFAATSIAASPGGFKTFTLPDPLTINSGDFVVGFNVPNDPGTGFPAAIDTNNPAGRSFASSNGAVFGVENGNYLIRAQVFGNCSLPPATPTPTPSPTPTATATATATATPTAGPATVLANISTRLKVETGDNILIGGFIVSGTQDKKVIIRAIGPSLSVAGKLENPTLELRNSGGALLRANDDWRVGGQEAEIIATTIPPSHDLESAIVATLPANNSAYTAIVRGVNNTTGVAVVEVYDLDRTVNSKLANISTRGLVQTGDTVLIAGTIVLGPSTQKVIIRAIGPSLTVPGKLADPTLQLRDANGALVRENDDWATGGQAAEITATGIPPTDSLESAIVETLNGNGAAYTAIVRGLNDSTGIAVVEVYALQ